MKKILLLSFIVILMIFTVSCSTSQQVADVQSNTTEIVETPIEKERVINKSFDEIWMGLIELFATYNMPIKTLDRSSGFIATEYKAVSGNPNIYMKCSGASSDFWGKVELTNFGGSMNVLVKKVTEDSTSVTLNAFYSCSANKYRYASIISTDYVFESSTRLDCPTTGVLEKAILDHLSMK